MSNDKMREEFEAWTIREFWLAECALARKKSGVYRDSRAAFAWAAWQASRAALVVELPFEFVNGMMRADQVIAAIEAAGVRVKS